ncbi:MAG: repressor LexA [Proteobacteria bacterium]|nr:repressor LexA [Pseudomonadota bacterium]
MALTSRQRELLDFIIQSVERESRMPSYREMAKGLGVAAVGTIQDHIKALVEQGYLEREEYGEKSVLKLASHRRSSAVTVPIIGEVAAGSLQDAFEVAMGTLPLSPEFLPSPLKGAQTSTPGEQLFALRVKGESMIDAGIHPKDFVIVQKGANVRTGDIVVASLHGEATVKEIEMPRKSGDALKLIPKNSRMKPILVEPNEDVRILGKVIAVHRYF